MNHHTSTGGKRYVQAPYQDFRHTSAITGVWLYPHEDVEWHTQVNPDGSISVTGYTITNKPVGVVDTSGIEI